MRVLLVSNPGIGHVNPMFPVARALAEAGNEVAFATAGGFCPVVEARGFPAFAAGLDWSEPELERAFPETVNLSLDERGLFLLQDVFADTAAHRMVPDLIRIAHDWKTDLLLRNDYEFATCVAAERLGLPQATISICFFMPAPVVGAVVGEQLAYLRSAHGLKPYPSTEMLYPHLYLTYAPAELEPRVFAHMHGIQPASPADTPVGDLPAWTFPSPRQPLIYVSLGTVFNRNPRLFATILEGLRGEPVNVIVTIGRNQDPAVLGPQPANIVIEPYIPQERIFPHASLFVTHSPFYTAMSALRFGVPLLMIPQAGDQPAHAMRIAQYGAGLVLRQPEHTDRALWKVAPELSSETVRESVRNLLDNPKYRNSAAQASRTIVDLPGPEHAAGLLEKLAGKKTAAHA